MHVHAKPLVLTVLALGAVLGAVLDPALAAPTPVQAAPTLAVGDPAPPLAVERWLRGDPIPALEEGRVHVVELWATWCAPCIQAIPHLSALQAEYRERGVTVVGVNVRELRRSGGGYEESFDPETLAGVEAFVARQGERMAYAVAYDGAAKAMDAAWLQASGGEGLPATFVVDRAGRIAWIGHPTVLRMPLHEIVAGTWDLATGPARVKAAEEAYLGALRTLATDLDAGLAAWSRAEEEFPLLATDLVRHKFDALLAAGHCAAAWDAGEVLLEQGVKARDVAALNRLAWTIVDPGVVREPRDLDLALRAARAAHELSGQRDPGVIDTLARVRFRQGKVDEAIELQSRAIELAGEADRATYRPALEEYERARR